MEIIYWFIAIILLIVSFYIIYVYITPNSKQKSPSPHSDKPERRNDILISIPEVELHNDRIPEVELHNVRIPKQNENVYQVNPPPKESFEEISANPQYQFVTVPYPNPFNNNKYQGNGALSTPFQLNLLMGTLPRQHHGILDLFGNDNEIRRLLYNGYEFNSKNIKTKETEETEENYYFSVLTSDIIINTTINGQPISCIQPITYDSTCTPYVSNVKQTPNSVRYVTKDEILSSRVYYDGYLPNSTFSNYYAKGSVKVVNPSDSLINVMYGKLDVTEKVKNAIYEYWIGLSSDPNLTNQQFVELTGKAMIFTFKNNIVRYLSDTDHFYIPQFFPQSTILSLSTGATYSNFPRVYAVLTLSNDTSDVCNLFWATLPIYPNCGLPNTSPEYNLETMDRLFLFYVIGNWRENLTYCCDEDAYIEAIYKGVAKCVKFIPKQPDFSSSTYISYSEEHIYSSFVPEIAKKDARTCQYGGPFGNFMFYGGKEGIVVYKDNLSTGTYNLYSNIIPVDVSSCTKWKTWTPFHEYDGTQTVFSSVNIANVSDDIINKLYNNVSTYCQFMNTYDVNSPLPAPSASPAPIVSPTTVTSPSPIVSASPIVSQAPVALLSQAKIEPINDIKEERIPFFVKQSDNDYLFDGSKSPYMSDIRIPLSIDKAPETLELEDFMKKYNETKHKIEKGELIAKDGIVQEVTAQDGTVQEGTNYTLGPGFDICSWLARPANIFIGLSVNPMANLLHLFIKEVKPLPPLKWSCEFAFKSFSNPSLDPCPPRTFENFAYDCYWDYYSRGFQWWGCSGGWSTSIRCGCPGGTVYCVVCYNYCREGYDAGNCSPWCAVSGHNPLSMAVSSLARLTCPPNSTSLLFTCYDNCPPDMTDIGLACVR